MSTEGLAARLLVTHSVRSNVPLNKLRRFTVSLLCCHIVALASLRADVGRIVAPRPKILCFILCVNVCFLSTCGIVGISSVLIPNKQRHGHIQHVVTCIHTIRLYIYYVVVVVVVVA
jgi:hypothetical protein